MDEMIHLDPNGTLDLHQFKPSDTKELIEEFIFECKNKQIQFGKIIHGKGIGTLREIVHAELRKHPDIQSFQLGSHDSGSWGATLFELKQ